MSNQRRGGADAAGAGALLIAPLLLGAAIGLGAGALIGAPVPVSIVGGAVGLAAGFWLAYGRFRNV